MANEHTQINFRCLLSCVKLSASSSFYSSSNSSETIKDTGSMQKTLSPPSLSTWQDVAMADYNWEYLTETVHGWQFEDLLHNIFSSPPTYGLCKSGNGNNVLPHLVIEIKNMGLWDPQKPCPLNLAQTGGETGLKEAKVAMETSYRGRKGGWKEEDRSSQVAGTSGRGRSPESKIAEIRAGNRMEKINLDHRGEIHAWRRGARSVSKGGEEHEIVWIEIRRN